MKIAVQILNTYQKRKSSKNPSKTLPFSGQIPSKAFLDVRFGPLNKKIFLYICFSKYYLNWHFILVAYWASKLSGYPGSWGGFRPQCLHSCGAPNMDWHPFIADGCLFELCGIHKKMIAWCRSSSGHGLVHCQAINHLKPGGFFGTPHFFDANYDANYPKRHISSRDLTDVTKIRHRFTHFFELWSTFDFDANFLTRTCQLRVNLKSFLAVIFSVLIPTLILKIW